MNLEIDEFLNNFFKEIKKITEFHMKYLKDNNFKTPNVDYLQLKDFIETSVNQLSELDHSILTGLSAKLYQDIESIYQYYKSFSSKVKIPQTIFYQNFLSQIEFYKKLSNELEIISKNMEQYRDIMEKTEDELKLYLSIPTNREDIIKYKSLKKRNVDSIYYFSDYREKYKEIKTKLVEFEKEAKLKFFPKFKQLKSRYLRNLEIILKTKLFYFEKLFWYNAQKSPIIQKFFDEANIQGDFSTKTLIQYQLKNIDITKSNNSEWIEYLNQVLKIIK